MASESFTCSPEQAQKIYDECKSKEGWNDSLLSTTVYNEDETHFYVRAHYRDDTKPHLFSIREIVVEK